MRRFAIFALVLTLLTLGGVIGALTTPSPAGAATPPTGIAGTVRDTAGRPLSAIEVTVVRQNDWGWYDFAAIATTGASGAYKITGLTAGTYRLGFGDPQSRYAPVYYDGASDFWSGTDVTVVSGAVTSGVNAQLLRYGSVSGTIAEADGTPLSQAYVALEASCEWGWNWVGGSSTDDAGQYTITSVPPTPPGQRLDIRVWADGFHDASYLEVNGTDGFSLREGQALFGIDLSLVEYEHITGTVRNSTGEPLQGIWAEALRWDEYSGWYAFNSAYTDEQGSYDLWAGQAGSYRVRFRDDAHVYADRFYGGQATAEEATPVDVAPGQTVTGIDCTMDLMPRGSISGKVTGAGDTPLAGASVRLYHDYWDQPIAGGTTGFDGTYAFAGLTASEFSGDYYVECIADGYVTQWFGGSLVGWYADRITLAPGQDVVADVQLSQPDPSCRISGHVTNAAGQPLADVWVEIMRVRGTGSPIYATTDGAGYYAADGLEPGGYDVFFQCESYLWTFWGAGSWECPDPNGSITLTSHEARDDIDVTLHRWNSISGQVRLTDGTPARSAFIYIQRTDGSGGYEDWTDEDGRYRASLEPGSYTVRFSLRGEVQYYDGAAEESEATPIVFDGMDGVAEHVDAEFAPPGGRIEGTVSASDGGSVAGVEVAAYYIRGYDYGSYEAARVTVGADGRYSLAGLEAREYYIGFFDPQGRYGGEFYDDAGRWDETQPIALARNEVLTGRDATLEAGGQICGTVTDENGVGLAGVTVEAYYQGLWYGGCGTAGEYVRMAVTGADGSYAIGALTAGGYRVHFVPPASSFALSAWYQDAAYPSQTPVTVNRDQATTGVDRQLGSGGRIAGTVTDSAAQPYSLGGSVSTVLMGPDGYDYGVQCQIGSDGSFLTPALPAGEYRVGFELQPPFTSFFWQDKEDSWDADLVTVTAGQTTSLAVTAHGEASISGTVRDAEGPVERADSDYYGPVRLYRQMANGYWRDAGHSGTDENGAYAFTHLSPGTYRVRVDGWRDASGEWWDDAHVGSLPTDIVLTEGQARTGVDVFLDPQGTVSGRVTDAAGRPLEGILVVAYGNEVDPWWGQLDRRWLNSASTDEDGWYSLPVDSGTCWLVFNEWVDPKYGGPGSGDLTVTPGGRLSVDMVLRSAWVDLTSATHPEQYRWYNSDTVTMSWTPLDPAFVAGYTYHYDLGAGWFDLPELTQDTSVTCPILMDGYWWFSLLVWDIEGGQSWYSYPVYSDRTAPVTTVRGAGTADVWKTTPIRLRYSAYDAYSGVAFTESSVDGGPWIKGATYKVTTDGVHTIAYRSTDNAGNVEEAQTLTLQIDRTAPVTTQTGADDAWHNAAVTVRFAATDATSGMTGGLAATQYSTDDGVTWATGTSVTVKGDLQGGTDGEHPILYRSVDAAGNVEAPQAINVKIDTRAPSTVASAVVTATRGTTVSLPYRVNDPLPTCGTATAWIVIRDENDRVMATLPKVVVAVNQPQTQTYLCTLKPGNYRYWVKAVDAAGNQELSSGGNKLIVK